MEIRNRMDDVEKICCNALQEFLNMILMPGWQEKLYDKAKKAIDEKDHADKYITAYDKMRAYGVSNYQVTDMDISFIATVVGFCGDIVSVKNATNDAFRRVVEDRNIKGHSNKNESDEELYLRGILTLRDLSKFIKVIDNVEKSIDDDIRKKYTQKYTPKIENLQKLLDEERINLIQGKKERAKDIKRIIESDNSDREWINIHGKYFNNYMLINRDMDSYFQFLVEAAEAGIVQAYSLVAQCYYDLEKYDDAEYYLHKLYLSDDTEYHDVESMMLLAEIYFKKLSDRQLDGHEIIQKLIEEGNNIIKSDDGKRYEWISRSSALKDKCLYAIDIPE